MNYEDTFLATKKKLLPTVFGIGFVLRFEVIALEISQGIEGGLNNCLVRLSEEQNESSFL